MNYEHIFWNFWKPHTFETHRHKYSLYWYKGNKFIGLIKRNPTGGISQ